MYMSNQANKFIKRASHPQTLGGAIGGLLKIFGIRASDADLSRRWSEIMGSEISSIAVLAAIKKTHDNKYNIVIRPTNPAFTLQLSYMAPDITERINKYFGYDAVAKISFRK